MNGTVIWVICSSSGGKCVVVVGKVKRAAQVRHKCGGGCESNYTYLYICMQQIEPRVVILYNVYKGQNTCAYYGRATQDKQSDEHKHTHNNIWTFAMSLQVEVYYTCILIYNMLHCINSLRMCITWPGGGCTRDSMNITISCLVILRCPACNRISHKLLCTRTYIYVLYSVVEHYLADIRFFWNGVMRIIRKVYISLCDCNTYAVYSCVVVYQFS